MPLLDSFIRLAQRDLCSVRWTLAILEEAQRNLIKDRGDEARIRRRFSSFLSHFDDWEITGYETLIPSMKCHDKDRHVLAAAVRGGASHIVTRNVRDFPQVALQPHGIEVISPDAFLLYVLHADPQQTRDVILEQAAALQRPPLTVDDVLSTLSRCGASGFADELGTIIAAAP